MTENANVVVETAEATATEVTPVVNEMFTAIPSGGKQALIIAGSALAGIGAYLLVTKVIVPKGKAFAEKHSKKQ